MSSTKFTFLALAAIILGVNSAPPQKIVNGVVAKENEFPYMVSLRIASRNYHFCGGAIISERHILTAAHCLVKKNMAHVIVVVGSNKVSREGTSCKILRATWPKNYVGLPSDENAFYDIAIITLRQPLSRSERRWKSIKMASQDYPVGSRAIIAGWGNTYQDAVASSYNLLKLETTLAGTSDCLRYIRSFRKDYHVCTIPVYGTGACQGDSGGPIVVNGEVVGVASYTSECGSSSSIFSKVTAYKGFIKKETGIKL